MPNDVIDSLSLEVNSDASNAISSLDDICRKLESLNSSVASFSANGLSNYSKGLGKISGAVQSFNRIDAGNLSKVIVSLKQLNNIDFSNLENKNIKVGIDLSNVDMESKLKYAIDKAIDQTIVDTNELSAKLISAFDLKGGAAAKLRSQMKELAKTLTTSFDGEDFAANSEMVGIIDSIAENIKKSGSVAKSNMDSCLGGIEQEWQEFYDYFKNKRIYVSEMLKFDIGRSEFKELLQSHLGNITVDATKGINLDASWSELADRFPTLISKDTLNAADQLLAILEKLSMVRDAIKPISFEEMSGKDATLATNKVYEELVGATDQISESVRKHVGDAIQSAEGQIPIEVKINEDKIVRDIRNAINKAAETKFSPIKVDLSIDSEGLKNSIAEKFSKIDVGNIPNVANAMKQISDSVSGLGSINLADSGINSFVNAIRRLSIALKDDFHTDKLKELITVLQNISAIPDVSAGTNRFVASIARLAAANANVASTVKELPKMGSALSKVAREISDIKISQQINEFVSSLSKLAVAGDKINKTSVQLEELGQALKKLFTTLKSAPKVSKNTIAMTDALAKLAANGGKVGTATRGLGRGFNNLNNGVKRSRNGLGNFNSALSKTNKGIKNTTLSIAGLAAKFWVLKNSLSMMWKPIENSMNFLETFNYFQAAFSQIEKNAGREWSTLGENSANQYVKSFGERARELTSKMSGYDVSDKGALVENKIGKSLGMDVNMLMNYQATFAQLANSIGATSEQSLKLSNALSMIGADLASVKNEDFTKVYENLSSGLVGMSRAVDKYGINIRNANLQQRAQSLGIQESVAKMSQAEKALLRTIVILDSSRYAWTDMAKTINLPANQLRIFRQNLVSVARAIGNLLLPIVAKVLPYLNGMLIAIRRLIETIGRLFGVDKKIQGLFTGIGGGGENLSNVLDSIEQTDISDIGKDANKNLEDATKNAKKLNKWLASYDELEIMSQNDDSLSSLTPGINGVMDGIGNYSDILNGALDSILDEYQKKWDAAYNSMDNKAMAFAKRIEDMFKRLAKVAEPTTKSLVKLWNNGLKKFRDFTWTSLKDFWQHFLVPVGKWTLGEGLPRLIDAFDKFLVDIHWDEINASLVRLWDALAPFAENVASGLIDFFEDLLGVGSKLVNKLPTMIDAIAGFIKSIKPDTAKKIGYGLGQLLTAFAAFKGLSWFGKIFSESGLIGKGFAILKSHPYSSIAFGIGTIITALDGFGIIDVDWDMLWEKISRLKNIISEFIKKIDWDSLATAIANLWDVIQPFISGFADTFLDFFDFMVNTIGAPAINSLSKAIGWLADKISNLSPELIREIGKAIGGLVIIKGIVDFSSKLTGLAGAFKTLKGSLSGIGGVLSTASGALTSFFGSAMGTNLVIGFLNSMTVLATAMAGFNLGKWISVNLFGGEDITFSDFMKENIFGYQKGDFSGAIEEIFKDIFNLGDNLSDKDLEAFQKYEDAILDLVRAGSLEGTDAYNLMTYLSELQEYGYTAEQALADLELKLQGLGIDSETFQITMDNIGKPLEEIANNANVTKNQFSEMSDKISSISFDNIEQQLTDFKTTLQTVDFATLVTDTANAIDEMGGIWENGKQILGEKALKIYQEISKGLEPDENGYYTLANGQMVQFGNGISDYEDTLVNTLNTTLQNAINSALESETGFELYTELGKNQIKACADGVATNETTLSDQIKTTLTNSTNGTKVTATSSGKTLGAAMVQGIEKGFGNEQENVKLSILDLVNGSIKNPAAESLGIHSPSTWFKDLAKYCGTGFEQGLNPGFANTFIWFRGFRNRVANSIGSLYGIGRNVITGLNNGIVEGASKLAENVRRIAESIGNTFRKVLQIHSPSKIMEDIGSFTMQGLLVGFDDMIPKLESSIGGIGRAIQNIPIGDIKIATKPLPKMQMSQQPKAVSASFGDDIRREIYAISNNTFDNNQNIGAAVKSALNGMAIYAGDRLVGYLQEEDERHRNRNGFGLFEGV